MSFSPVPGAGTLLRVEEVRQRLNQCGLQGEKVTRKTARKYVPPTATASRTVADMARRLGSPCGGRGAVPGRGTAGSTDAAGRSGDSPGEPHANGAEEKIVTGEIYRTFSIHTRNIHKKFSTVSENTAESVASKTDTSEATNVKKATTNNDKNNSQSSAPSIKIETNNMVSKSTVITNNSSTPNKPAPSPHQKQISSSPLNNTPASKPVSSIAQHAPASTQNGHATVAKDKDMTKYNLAPDKNKSTPPPTKPKPETNKIGPSVNKQPPAEVKKNTPPHSVQSSIKDKFAAFVGKNTASENLQISVKDSDANIPNEVKQKEQTGQASPKPASFFNKLVQKTLKSKPNPANNTPENKPSAPASKKPVLSQTKSAQSSGRRNIQDIRNSPEINNSPKIPKKDTDETKNKPSSIKDECPKICTTNDKLSHKKPTSPSSNKKPTSPFHNNNSSNIPITNNNSNCNSNTISNKSSALSTQCKTDIDVKEKEKPNSGVERTTSDIESNSITTETDSSKEDNKPNGSVEPMDCTGVCFYKAKCLLQDPSSMGSKEKVKVDESEPSFYEEAPFERRDVTVKSDRWVTDFYMVDSLLGKGKFGEVKKCQERKTGRQLAAKFIEVNGPQDRNDVLNELEIMKNLQHPRLLQLYDAFEVRDKFCLVMELVNGGELFERVINEDFILTEKACVMFTRQICDGIAFMHSQNILHLDMK
ncbi:myosin light chain kinase, smooth muscle, partial [Plakobranchus ocellatus]